ncbi:hypothetical protein [Nocardia exalbida]|uniref:hypothetical protein n=1 Tax=Nocardia exalbida TaxID=290231 RepID=UPI0002D8CF37|nr:hypothetical protein [Nocardia exalbida]
MPGHGSGALEALDRIDVDVTEPNACLTELFGGVDARMVGLLVTGRYRSQAQHNPVPG